MEMRNRYTLMAGLFALDVALFALAGIPAFKNAHHGVKFVLGGVGWFGGLAVALVLIALACVTLVQRARPRRHTAV
jgi:hypothetical protein